MFDKMISIKTVYTCMISPLVELSLQGALNEPSQHHNGQTLCMSNKCIEGLYVLIVMMLYLWPKKCALLHW